MVGNMENKNGTRMNANLKNGHEFRWGCVKLGGME